MSNKHKLSSQKVSCDLCGRRVCSTFQGKWSHLANYHVEVLIQSMLPYLFNPSEAQALGLKAAEHLRSKPS